MSSTAPTEFLPFPKLPPELRDMVWDEALPTLDLQRFNAEIAPHPDTPKSCKSKDLVLCLTPHEDFVQLTSGFVGLLSACRESRRAAITKIKCHLPINYIARDADGLVAVRFAKVPFNPDGHLCISGLGSALQDAKEGFGARGMDLSSYSSPYSLPRDIQCATFPAIKNLTITLDMSSKFEGFFLFLLAHGFIRWDHSVFHIMAKRMTKLDTVALVDECWMNERHRIDAKDFEWLHKPAPVVRPRGDDDDESTTVKIPWEKLFREFKSGSTRFTALKEFRAGPVDARAS